MTPEEYRRDPCGASSLPYWKTNSFSLPLSLTVVREDLFSAPDTGCVDTPYFKLVHRLEVFSSAPLPAGFSPVYADECSMAEHISRCYDQEAVSADELRLYKSRSVYSADLWLAVRENDSGMIAATGIAEFDGNIREGVLEWIQVSPGYRRQGLGRFLVNELLLRLKGRADFVTVSGRVDNASNPFALYLSCGFSSPVIWHVIRKRAGI